ncbi:hypothetical protein AGMMS49949_06900 [Alphaproteobacteria bacterium]|nr:hypothetical protein AGMMS49949_06900 [Alphaproteobacteria bacterium]GHS98594.1 hypothetical protein AGMMS50296_6350 [Alphaproteobacteria bacterium]
MHLNGAGVVEYKKFESVNVEGYGKAILKGEGSSITIKPEGWLVLDGDSELERAGSTSSYLEPGTKVVANSKKNKLIIARGALLYFFADWFRKTPTEFGPEPGGAKILEGVRSGPGPDP